MFAEMRKSKPHQQRISEHLADFETGEQTSVIKVIYDFVPDLEMMNQLPFIAPERLLAPLTNRRRKSHSAAHANKQTAGECRVDKAGRIAHERPTVTDNPV